MFCKNRPLPSELMTAVAFEVWDEVCAIFGRYEGIMRILGRVLKSSVYLEAAASDVRDSHHHHPTTIIIMMLLLLLLS